MIKESGCYDKRAFWGGRGFTLVEVMVGMAIFAMAFIGVSLAYSQAVKILDSLRQTSRAEDIILSNIEFLRTRSWEQLTNVYVTTSSTTPSQTSSNMTESISSVVSGTTTNSPVCTHLELISTDPLRVALRSIQRDLQFSPNPATTVITTQTMLTATVLISWETWKGNRITNSMTTYLTKGGMTADVTQ